MVIKVINDTAGLNGLITTFFIFDTYLYILEIDAPTSTITNA